MRISRIIIKDFKGISTVELDPVRPINVLIGRNNSGKTSILACIHLLHTYAGGLLGSPGSGCRVPSEWFRRHLDQTPAVEVSVTVVQTRQDRDGAFKKVPSPEIDSERIAYWLDSGRLFEQITFVFSARSADEAFGLSSIRGTSATDPEVGRLHARFTDSQDSTLKLAYDWQGRRPISLGNMGGGVEQLLVLACLLIHQRTDCILLEEPESHLHPAAQELLLDRLEERIGSDQLLFLTTHSPVFVRSGLPPGVSKSWQCDSGKPIGMYFGPGWKRCNRRIAAAMDWDDIQEHSDIMSLFSEIERIARELRRG